MMDGFKNISPTLLVLLIVLLILTITIVVGFLLSINNMQLIGLVWLITLAAIVIYHSSC